MQATVSLKTHQLKRLAPQTHTVYTYIRLGAMVRYKLPTNREHTTRVVAFLSVAVRLLLRMRASGVLSTPYPHFQLDVQPSVGNFGVEVLQSRGTDDRTNFDPHEYVSLRQRTTNGGNVKPQGGQMKSTRGAINDSNLKATHEDGCMPSSRRCSYTRSSAYSGNAIDEC